MIPDFDRRPGSDADMIDPVRDAQVLERLDQWDALMAEGRFEEAERLIPDRGREWPGYREVPGIFRRGWFRLRRARMTRHPNLRAAGVVRRDVAYERGHEGGLSYSLHLDGRPSRLWADFQYEPAVRGFRLTLIALQW